MPWSEPARGSPPDTVRIAPGVYPPSSMVGAAHVRPERPASSERAK
jgi:hypothetical protein